MSLDPGLPFAESFESGSSRRLAIPPLPTGVSLLQLSCLVGADGVKWGEQFSRVQHADITSCVPGSDIRALPGDIWDTGIWEKRCLGAWVVTSVGC